MKLNYQVDSQQLFQQLLQTAQFPEDKQRDMVLRFEAAVFSTTLKTLLSLLPAEQRKKLETTMHFQPEFFLDRAVAILQTIASVDQIVKIFEKTSEETFLNFFDTFLLECTDEQKKKIDQYLNQLS